MAFDPESGLSLTGTFPVSNNISQGAVARDSPAVFAVDFVGLDGSAGGCVYEQGASGVGCYVGFRANGDFVCRAGDGGTPWPAATGYILDGSGVVSGDGTLVFEFVPGSPVTVRAWWNGVGIGTPVASSVAETQWAGTNAGSFMSFALSLVDGEVDAAAVATSHSDLRYYADQTVQASPGISGTAHTDPDTFGSHLVAVGPVTISGTREVDVDGFGTGTIRFTLTGAAFVDPDQIRFGAVSQGGGAQQITGGAFADPDTTPGGALDPGPVGVQGAAHTDPDTFRTHLVGRGAVQIAGVLHIDGDSIPGGKLSAGVVIQGALFADGDVIRSSVLVPGAVDVQGAAHSDADSFGVHQILTGGALAGGHFSDPDVILGGTVDVGAVGIAGALFVDPDTLGQSAAQAIFDMLGATHTDADTFGTHQISASVDLGGVLYVDPDVIGSGRFGSPTVEQQVIGIWRDEQIATGVWSTEIVAVGIWRETG
ncbi:hypothetical protein [Maritimibacter sp. 55A14]|uniref:hypothetical protein n=1 Tax=Maritimibacter sp. 55A14 TaxID=2174844 RepID=UPI0011B274B7|nr:hypothetical protein [Maritimibacter sp. 55A14]